MDNAKRNLVKAAVAAPMVFTVRTASAQALASSGVCVQQDATRAATENPVNAVAGTPTDDWYRLQKPIFNLYTVNSNDQIAPNPVKTQSITNQYYLGLETPNPHYWLLQQSGSSYTGATDTGIVAYATGAQDAAGQKYTTSPTLTGQTTSPSVGQLYLIVWQNNGQIVYVGWKPLSTTPGTNITFSCWTSITPTV